MKIHHIGYLVKNIAHAAEAHKLLGWKNMGGGGGQPYYDENRDADMLFMQNGGYVIELVAPRSERSVVWRLNKKLGNTPYHICYESDDWESDVKALLDNGFMQITEKSHAPAIGNAQVAFYMSRDIGMVELLDKVE